MWLLRAGGVCGRSGRLSKALLGLARGVLPACLRLFLQSSVKSVSSLSHENFPSLPVERKDCTPIWRVWQ